MKPTTLELIKNVLAADETVQPDEIETIMIQIKTLSAAQTVRPGTIIQAAEILDVHPGTVRRYGKTGLLTPIRITARNVQYDLNEVELLAHTGRTQEK